MLPPEMPWQALQGERPLAARLALLTCLPVRVTPAFLRLARLRLVSEASTGDEADLWLSDLVESRSSAGLSYRRTVREELRQRLAAEPALLDTVWTQVHLEHAPWLAARGRLEEELTWRLLRDAGDAWIDERWRAVLDELETGPNAEGVARWVVRAVPDLPPGALDFESGRRAYYGANLLLGDASVLGTEVQTFLDTNQFAFATRRLPRRIIHVGRVEGGVLVSPLRPIEQGYELDMPATRPLWLQVEGGAGTGDGAPQVITLSDHETLTCPTGSDTVSLRLIDGSAYSIGPVRSSSQKFMARSRSPRVQIEYEVEVYGALKNVQLPFVTGVLADLSGHRSEPLLEVADRKFLEIDADNFDDRMKAMRPRLAFQVTAGAGLLAVELVFEKMDDFSPAVVVDRIEPLRVAIEERSQLAGLLNYADGKPETFELLQQMWTDARILKALARRRGSDKALRETALSRVQVAFKTRDDTVQRHLESCIGTWARQALAWPSAHEQEPAARLRELIGRFDEQLSSQLRDVMHHPHFQQLESAWRGLHYLVHHTETSEFLKIRVMNISKQELGETLAQYPEDLWDQSPIMKKVYAEAYSQFGGQPYGCLVGDFQFDNSPADVALLGAMAKVAAASFAPFIAAASPALMQMESWRELANPRDLTKIFATPEYAGWNALRDSEEARFLALALPRFLARSPYGAETNPVEEFSFEELPRPGNHEQYVWANAAYAMAANIHRAFTRYGWCASIRGVESGGLVEGLPVHTFRNDDGEVDMMCPTEFAVSDRRESELSRNGLMPMVHRKNSEFAAFIGAQSVQKPPDYDDPDATANANLAARLPYLFAACRFSQHLKCMVRDKIGSFRGRSQVAQYLQDWILSYVDGDPEHSSEQAKARRPLAAAEIQVEEVPDGPGYYQATIFLRPHYQLEGLTQSLRMVTKLPSG